MDTATTTEVSALPDLVAGIMLLMLAASLTAMMGNKLPKLPFTIALVLAGMMISALAPVAPFFDLLAGFELTPELVLFVFLPTLIFESAHNLQVRQLQANILPVLTLAVPGLLISTSIIASLFYALSDFPFIICMLLGAILSATDPVSVIALFKQLGVPERLTVLVEGESLFNDATSLVLATLLTGIALTGEFDLATVGSGLIEFLKVFFGGILVGWLLAFLVCQILGTIDAQPAVEISFTTVLAYLAFLIAEHGLHVSGIMAVVAAGLIMGSYGRSKISPSTEHYLHDFWDYAAWLANAMIFLLVGMKIDLLAYWDSLGLIALVAVAMLLSRALVIFGLVPQLARLPDSEPVSRSYQLVMYWGGLRGAIAVAIVLSLPEFSQRDTLIAVVMGAVLFSLLVQGLSIETLVRRLGLDKPEFADQLAEKEGGLHAKQMSLASVDRLEQGGFFSRRVAERLRSDGEKSIEQLQREIKTLSVGMTKEEARRILSLRTLAREKKRYEEFFRRGLIGDWAYRELFFNVEQQSDDAKHYGHLPGSDYRHSPTHNAFVALLRSLQNFPLVSTPIQNRLTRQMMRDYDVSWARYRTANSVLKSLEELAEESGVSGDTVEQLRQIYENVLTDMETEITLVSESYPEFVEAAQERLGQRLLIISEQEALARAGNIGILPEGVIAALKKQQQTQLRNIARRDLTRYLEVSVTELLNKVPLFSGLADDQFQAIIKHLNRRSVPKGEKIIRQGDRGDSLFMIARGLVAIVDERQNAPTELKRLYAGDFFGEAALLHGTPRNATVEAITPCTVYELHRERWRLICNDHPEIEEAVQRVDRQRSQ
ncbi:cyclic nucleotide-binding domain-containing protein [Pseudomaricurvus alkylphenolicus]|uniref:cation:proton antiporter n=1 Tax=Pseudomaricurvus alkylphenolicus TaxID=1306991 RepID=UPI0014227240|nr:cation:proton antiporter [Pseudomaricurvus alkylphenolicus]NIB39309.1 cyclic nucleotide-binding domain-containing protein [Pseudomaricurvus alkylphenolicus]